MIHYKISISFKEGLASDKKKYFWYISYFWISYSWIFCNIVLLPIGFSTFRISVSYLNPKDCTTTPDIITVMIDFCYHKGEVTTGMLCYVRFLSLTHSKPVHSVADPISHTKPISTLTIWLTGAMNPHSKLVEWNITWSGLSVNDEEREVTVRKSAHLTVDIMSSYKIQTGLHTVAAHTIVFKFLLVTKL